eukprot:gene14952-biopygen3632
MMLKCWTLSPTGNSASRCSDAAHPAVHNTSAVGAAEARRSHTGAVEDSRQVDTHEHGLQVPMPIVYHDSLRAIPVTVFSL